MYVYSVTNSLHEKAKRFGSYHLRHKIKIYCTCDLTDHFSATAVPCLGRLCAVLYMGWDMRLFDWQIPSHFSGLNKVFEILGLFSTN